MTPCDTNTFLGLTIPSATELYDALMGPIEKDLTTAELPLLESRYANETPEQSLTRAARYMNAFHKYQEKAALYRENLEQELHQREHAAAAAAETTLHDAEIAATDSLLS